MNSMKVFILCQLWQAIYLWLLHVKHLTYCWFHLYMQKSASLQGSDVRERNRHVLMQPVATSHVPLTPHMDCLYLIIDEEEELQKITLIRQIFCRAAFIFFWCFRAACKPCTLMYLYLLLLAHVFPTGWWPTERKSLPPPSTASLSSLSLLWLPLLPPSISEMMAGHCWCYKGVGSRVIDIENIIYSIKMHIIHTKVATRTLLELEL